MTHLVDLPSCITINSCLVSCSIRALCGKDSQRNCVHGSDSTSSAEREINFFFKDVVSGLVVFSHPFLFLDSVLLVSIIDQTISVLIFAGDIASQHDEL